MPQPSNNPIRHTVKSKLPVGPAAATRSQSSSEVTLPGSSPEASNSRGAAAAPASADSRHCEPQPPLVHVPCQPPHHADDSGPDSEPDSESEEMAVVPDKFDGHVDARDWMEDFTAYTAVKKLDDSQAASMARFLFAGDGRTWYKTLPVDIRASYRALSAAFEAYWLHGPKKPNLGLKQRLASNATQKPGQSVPDFVHEVMSLAQGLDMSDAMILRIVESGLKPELLPFYRQANPQTPHDVIRCEALQVAAATTSSPNEGLLDAIDNLLSAKIKALTVAASVNTTTPQSQPNRAGRQQYQRRPPSSSSSTSCLYCGQMNCKSGKGCNAFGAICNYCTKKNHFASVCRTRLRASQQQQLHDTPQHYSPAYPPPNQPYHPPSQHRPPPRQPQNPHPIRQRYTQPYSA